MSDSDSDPNFAQIATVYCGIMDTIADRLWAVGESVEELQADPAHPNGWRNAEFCYLQIRKSVEYVALALVSAHQLYDASDPVLEEDWKADRIFHELKKINRHGFPTAVDVQIDLSGDGNHHIADAPSLTRRRMKRIYDDCAVHLHAGKLSDITNGTIPPYDMPRLVAWREELLSMLLTHKVMLPHIGIAMIVWLRDPDSGKAKAVFGAADGPFVIGDDPTIYNDDPPQ